MIKDNITRNFFQQLFSNYPENTLLKIIFNEWDNWNQKYLMGDDRIKRKELINDIIDLYKTYSIKNSDKNLIPNSIDASEKINGSIDLRIKSILLNNIKGFGIKSDDRDFGIDLSGNESIVILAENGLGKSSLFSLLEYLYTGQISEARLRGLEGSNYPFDYLQNLRNKGERPSAKLFCNDSRIFSLNEPIFHQFVSGANDSILFNPSVAFLSEYSIYEQNQETVSDFESKLFNLLGFEELSSISKYLDYIKSTESKLNTLSPFREISESKNQLGEIEDRTKILTNELNSLKNSITTNTNLDNLSNTITEYKNKISLIDDLTTNHYDNRSLLNLKNHLESVEQKVKELSNIEQFDFLKEEILFLKSGLNIFTGEECPFCNSSTLGKNEIVANVRKKLKYQENRIKNFDGLSIEIKELIEIQWSELINTLNTINSESKSINLHKLFEDDSNYNNYVDSVSDISSVSNENMILDFDEIYYSNTKKVDINKLNAIRMKYVVDQIRDYINSLPTKLFKDYDLFSIYTQARDRMLITYREKIQNRLEEFEASDGYEKIESNVRINQKIKALDDEIFNLEEKSERLLQTLNYNTERANLFRMILENSNVLKNEVDNFIREEFDKRISEDLVEIINSLMKLYFATDKIQFKLKLEETISDALPIKKLTFEVIDNVSGAVITEDPRKFFNSSRFKLLGLVSNLAVFILQRIQSNVNLPLCVDDEFFGVDLRNKIQSKFLFKSFFKSLEKYNQPDKPIQFIFFIHDQIIYENIRNAIYELRNETYDVKKIIPSKIIFSKMFDPKKSINIKKDYLKVSDIEVIPYNNFLYQLSSISSIEEEKKVRHAI